MFQKPGELLGSIVGRAWMPVVNQTSRDACLWITAREEHVCVLARLPVVIADGRHVEADLVKRLHGGRCASAGGCRGGRSSSTTPAADQPALGHGRAANSAATSVCAIRSTAARPDATRKSAPCSGDASRRRQTRARETPGLELRAREPRASGGQARPAASRAEVTRTVAVPV